MGTRREAHKYLHQCDGCGRGTDNIDGMCGPCKEEEDRYLGYDDDFNDDPSPLERRYEKEVQGWGGGGG